MIESAMPPAPIAIRRAESPADVRIARKLFEEYERSLGIDLCFQNFADELATLPGAYAPPRGALLIALRGETAVGCIALRPFPRTDTGELKRLYLRESVRGGGGGRVLVAAAIECARTAGYRAIVLDTLPEMHAAQHLYRSFGFRPYSPARPITDPPLVYLELELA